METTENIGSWSAMTEAKSSCDSIIHILRFDYAFDHYMRQLQSVEIEEQAKVSIFHTLISEVLVLDMVFPPAVDYLNHAAHYLCGVRGIDYEEANSFCIQTISFIEAVIVHFIPDFSSDQYHGRLSFEILNDDVVKIFIAGY
jgi:hypothetical protein